MATYFLQWIAEHHGQEWIDRHVEHLVCLGSPWIGAPKAIRSLVRPLPHLTLISHFLLTLISSHTSPLQITSDKQGLDYFLLDAEMLDFTRRQSASLSFLFLSLLVR